MQGIFKVVEYKPNPKHGIGAPPIGRIIKQFSGKKASEKANALRDKLNKKASDGNSYFVKGDLDIPSVIV
jgi:hypothetical protein